MTPLLSGRTTSVLLLRRRRHADSSHRTGYWFLSLPRTAIPPTLRKKSTTRISTNTSNAFVTTAIKKECSAAHQSSTSLGKAWAAYSSALERRPLIIKASMASVIFFSSDSVTQYLLRTRNHSNGDDTFQWDAVRALSAGNFGVMATTFLHFWWGFLERVVGARIPVAQYRLANTAAKVLIHQSMGAPFYIYSYYVLTNFGQKLHQAADGKDVVQAWKDVHEKAGTMLWPTMLRHWSVWPAVQSFNFYFTPLHHRVLVHNTVLIAWSGYLSYLNHNSAGCIMTAGEEIKAEIVRRDSLKVMKDDKNQQGSSTTSSAAYFSKSS